MSDALTTGGDKAGSGTEESGEEPGLTAAEAGGNALAASIGAGGEALRRGDSEARGPGAEPPSELTTRTSLRSRTRAGGTVSLGTSTRTRRSPAPWRSREAGTLKSQRLAAVVFPFPSPVWTMISPFFLGSSMIFFWTM